MAQRHRLHVPPGRIAPGTATILPAEAEYLGRVLRLAPGDALEVFDGAGGVFDARIGSLEPSGGTLSLGPRRAGAVAERPFVLLQGLAKGEKMELVVQKAVELGVTELVPVACARSVVKLDAEKGARRAERWRKIAAEAARQCGRADVPEVRAPVSLADAVRAYGARPELACAVAWEGEHATGLRAFLEANAHRPGHALLVGPEGGLGEDEVAAARAAGFVPVTLGRRILRTETAGLAVLSVVRYLQGELG